MKFLVVREHVGDKDYAVGDIREARENEVKHLIPHVLNSDLEAAEKKAPAEKKPVVSPENKAVQAENNKSE